MTCFGCCGTRNILYLTQYGFNGLPLDIQKPRRALDSIEFSTSFAREPDPTVDIYRAHLYFNTNGLIVVTIGFRVSVK
jgi:hypothetical protein